MDDSISSVLQTVNVKVCPESFVAVNTHTAEFSNLGGAFSFNDEEGTVQDEMPLVSFSLEAPKSPFSFSSDVLRKRPDAVKRLFSVIDDRDALVKMAEELEDVHCEGEAEVILACKLVKPLVGYCYPSKHAKSATLYDETDLELHDLGMGEARCWHGYADLVASPTPHFEDSDSSEVPTFITTDKSMSELPGDAIFLPKSFITVAAQNNSLLFLAFS